MELTNLIVHFSVSSELDRKQSSSDTKAGSLILIIRQVGKTLGYNYDATLTVSAHEFSIYINECRVAHTHTHTHTHTVQYIHVH